VGFNEWPHYEKVALLDALKKYGHYDMENLSKAVPGKSKDQIKMTIRMWWKAARLAMQASACSDKRNKDKLKCVPKRGRGRPSGPSKSVGPSESVAEDEAPIDQWLHMHEQSQPAGGYPETRLLLKVFLYISKYENHPPPEDCNGVDYRYVGTHFFCWSYCVFDSFTSGKSQLLYLFTNTVIKLTAVIIEAYHCCQLHTKFYLTFFSLR
jgi:hypothetical protein